MKYVEVAHLELGSFDFQEIHNGLESIVGGLLVSPVVVGIFVSRETHNCRRLQKQQIRSLVPTVLVAGQQFPLHIVIADQVWPDLLKHADQARTARSSVEPDSQRSGGGRFTGLHEYVVDFPAADFSVEIARIDSLIDHALNKRVVTGA